MGVWLVGVTLNFIDQVVTHLVPLGDLWKRVNIGEFQTAQEELFEVSGL